MHISHTAVHVQLHEKKLFDVLVSRNHQRLELILYSYDTTCVLVCTNWHNNIFMSGTFTGIDKSWINLFHMYVIFTVTSLGRDLVLYFY